MPFVTIESAQCFYRMRQNNASPALMLLHGSGGTSSVWDNQFEKLDCGGMLIAPDLPGHGESGGDPLHNAGDYVLWLDALISKLKIEHCFVAGHSLGGAIAQEFARRFPEKVRGLILIGCGTRFTITPHYLETVKNDFLSAVTASCRSAFAQANISRFYEWGFALLKDNGSEILYHDIVACMQFDSRPWIASLKTPVCILCGSEDKITPADCSEELARMIPHAELNIIPGAGHMVMLEEPEKFNDAMIVFINNVIADSYQFKRNVL